jgi:two-component system NtrC family response regulator
MATILVIDAAPSVRETLRIVLGHEHQVAVAASLDASPAPQPCDVLVLGLPPRPRDERALGAALAGRAPGVPVLLLHGTNDVNLAALVPPDVPVELLPKPFDAYGVRARVRTLLAARRPAASALELAPNERRALEFPFVSQTAAAVLRQIVTADVPVTLLQGEPGTGAVAVARALHRCRAPRGTFVTLAASRIAAGELASRVESAPHRVVTVYLSDVDEASDDVQGDLLDLVDDLERAPTSLRRLVVGTRRDLGELAAGGSFRSELAYALTSCCVALTPLRERTDDMDALVRSVTLDLRRRLRLPAVDYAPAALERLREYLWFGNVAELEAVLTRTLVLRRPTRVEADDLAFLPEDAPRAVATRTSRPAPAAVDSGLGSEAATTLAGLDLEVVLGELAHELKNPMVTIKTFAQHLDSVLADPEARTRLAALTTDAVTRMDDLLETLLDFARFRAPTLRPVDVQAVLERAVDEQTDALARRHVTVERNGARAGVVDADEQQVLFAFRSLCRGLLPDLVPHSPLTIRGGGPGVVEMRLRAEPSTAARLTKWVEPSRGEAETPPLAWALAAALVERNGGALRVRKEDGGGTVVRMEWPQHAD